MFWDEGDQGLKTKSDEIPEDLKAQAEERERVLD